VKENDLVEILPTCERRMHHHYSTSLQRARSDGKGGESNIEPWAGSAAAEGDFPTVFYLKAVFWQHIAHEWIFQMYLHTKTGHGVVPTPH
jgi:hypothetical protein